ncbi:MAG: XTP/dITP diphosphatase [Chloroflexota bacterium]
MTTLLIATNNEGKLREYRDLLAGLPVQLVSLREAGVDIEVEETGQTFAENAVLKASCYARASGLCTLADDSGLEVDALGGEPGVMSSRYAGPQATDADRVRFLLDKMKTVPDDQRSARFKCVIAVASPADLVETSEGTVEGVIASEPRGDQGFGYDPIFYLPEMTRTMAELPPAIKNRISHRARAAAVARLIIERLLREGKCRERQG